MRKMVNLPLLIESLLIDFFDIKSVVPLTIFSLVKGESKIAFLILLSETLDRRSSWSSFPLFSVYNNFENFQPIAALR